MKQKKATLEVRVQPGARRDEIVGLKSGVLHVRVIAPPRRGQANQALVALLAENLGLSKADFTLVQGYTSRNKVLAIQGLSPEELKDKLAQSSAL